LAGGCQDLPDRVVPEQSRPADRGDAGNRRPTKPDRFGLGGAPNCFETMPRCIVSWDGSRIAFAPNAQDSLWVMNRDGENAKKLLPAPDDYKFADPLWYPGDKTLLYKWTSRSAPKTSLKSFNLETGQPGLFSTAEDVGWEFSVLRDGRVLSFGSAAQADRLVRNQG
jgi:hypothetical protein